MARTRTPQGQFVQAVADPVAGPASDYIPVTPSDSTVYNPPLKAFRVGTAGNVAVVTLYGITRTIPNCVAGEVISLQVTKVMATNTTASNIGGFV